MKLKKTEDGDHDQTNVELRTSPYQIITKRSQDVYM